MLVAVNWVAVSGISGTIVILLKMSQSDVE